MPGNTVVGWTGTLPVMVDGFAVLAFGLGLIGVGAFVRYTGGSVTPEQRDAYGKTAIWSARRILQPAGAVIAVAGLLILITATVFN